MVAFLTVFTISILIFFYELPPLVKKKLYKEGFVFAFFQLAGTVLILLFFLNVPLPNPLDWIIMFIKPYSNLIENLLT